MRFKPVFKLFMEQKRKTGLNLWALNHPGLQSIVSDSDNILAKAETIPS